MTTPDYNDLLFKALQQSKYNEVKKHLPLADINFLSPIGLTFAHLAALTDKDNIVKLILNDSRLDLTSTLEPRSLASPIHIAYNNKNTKIMDRLIQKEPKYLNVVNCKGETIFHLAVKKQEEALITHLLTYNNIDIHIKNEEGQSALDIARTKGLEKLAVLLESYDLEQKITATQEKMTKFKI